MTVTSEAKLIGVNTEENTYLKILSEKQPTIEVLVNGTRFKSLVDTGSTRSLIKYDKELQVSKCDVRLVDAAGMPIKIEGKTEIRVGCGDGKEDITIDALVVDAGATFPGKLLLGTDLLENANAIIDFGNRSVQLWPNRIDNAGRKVEYIHAMNDVILGPFENAVISVPHGDEGKSYIIEGTKVCENRVLVARSWSVSNNKTCPVMMLNTSGAVTVIKKGTMLAEVSAAEDSTEEIEMVCHLSCDRKVETRKKKLFPDIDASQVSSGAGEQMNKKLLGLLNQYRDVVALDGEPLGKTNMYTHDVKLKDPNEVIYQRQYRIPVKYQDELDKIVDGMLKDGVISPSTSPYNFPVVLVKKKDGTLRMCIDFRRLNEVTIPMRFPLPIIQELVQKLRSSKVFSCLDLVSAFWQIPLTESTSEKMAFSTRKGKFRFNRLPFGLVDASASMSRCLTSALTEVLGVSALIYIDDIVVYSKSEEEHLTHLDKVFEKLRLAGLKVKLSKCDLFKEQIQFLGHTVSKEGVRVDVSKEEKINSFPVPRTKKEVKRLLGFTSYYRSFVPNYAKITEPIARLLKTGQEFEWKEEQEESFKKVKSDLLARIILSFPDFEKPFFIVTDASNYALGAALMQEVDGKLLPITFASKLLSETERRYSVCKKEALGVIYALKHFRYVILGYDVTILTDHRPLVSLFKRTLPEDSVLARYAVFAQEYCPKLRYIPGRLNLFADLLSRAPFNLVEEAEDLLDVEDRFEEALYYSEEISPMTAALQEANHYMPCEEEKLIEEQKKDPLWSPIRTFLTEEAGAADDVRVPEGMKMEDFVMHNNVLYYVREVKRADGEQDKIVLVIPESLASRAISLSHDEIDSGHVGRERTLEKLQRYYHVNNAKKKVRRHVNSCKECKLNNGRIRGRVPAKGYPVSSQPWERTSIDLMGPLPTTTTGNKYVMVVADFLTRFIIAVAIPNKEASTIVAALRKYLFSPFAAPMEIISDNAAEFVGSLFNNMCKTFGVKKTEVAPYHPASNGLVERANGKIVRALKIYVNAVEAYEWDEILPEVVSMINTTYNSSIGENPHFALFGWDKKYQVNWFDDGVKEVVYNYEDYFALLNRRMKTIRKFLKENLHDQTTQYLASANTKARKRSFIKGERCYVRYIPRPTESKKLAPNFEGPFHVEEVINNTNYIVRNVISNTKKRAHIDNMLAAGKPTEEEEERREKKEEKEKKEKRSKKQETIFRSDRTTRQSVGVRNHCAL